MNQLRDFDGVVTSGSQVIGVTLTVTDQFDCRQVLVGYISSTECKVYPHGRFERCLEEAGLTYQDEDTFLTAEYGQFYQAPGQSCLTTDVVKLAWLIPVPTMGLLQALEWTNAKDWSAEASALALKLTPIIELKETFQLRRSQLARKHTLAQTYLSSRPTNENLRQELSIA
jgi:hypothetical protein